jgi:tetratricopeptide (TPR) repeat protein
MEVTELVFATIEKNAIAARALAQYAVAVAGAIDAEAYPATILASVSADAWRALANAHRYLSEYDAALRAVSTAEHCITDVAAADWERTLVRFARAVILCDMQRFEEASSLAEEASTAFAAYKEFRRSGQALLVQGMIAHRQNRYDAAAAIFAQAVDVFERTDDLKGLASAYNNFGYAQAERDELPSAVLALQKALSIFDALEMRGEAARTRCILASVYVRSQKYERANELLTTGRRTFRDLGMVEENGTQGLVQADVLLALGRLADANTVITEVLHEFRRASLNERAVVALAYAQEMVGTSRGREAVTLVRRYVEDLRRSPETAFLPLPD